MPALFLVFILIFAPISSSLATPIEQSPRPKYSDIKKMSSAEVEAALVKYIGTKDNWRRKANAVSKFKSFISFKRKDTSTIEADRLNLSYIYAKKSSNSLQQYVLTSQNSTHPEIRSMVAVVLGDKRLAMDSYRVNPQSNIKSMLFFFQSLEYGDTGLEIKKFHEFSLAFNSLAHQLRVAYHAAAKLNMPVILEFESSALIAQSPLTRLFYKTLTNNPARILKIENTPNGGRLMAIHPYYAQAMVENVALFAEQLSKKIKIAQNKYFSDSDIKQRLIDLIRAGEGTSGLLYIDERIVELALQETKLQPHQQTCASLFN